MSAAEIMRYSRRELTGTEDGLVYYNRFNIEDVFEISGVSYVINHASGVTPYGKVSIAGNVATYTPNSNPPVNDYFFYRITDGRGVSWEYEVSININTVPTAADQSASGNEDEIQTITPSGNDPDGDTLSYALASQPSHGTVGLVGSTMTYTPAGNYNGEDSFTFTVSDGMATSSAVTMSINLTIALVGDFDFDGQVDFFDFFLFVDNFGATELSPEQTMFDLNEDGVVNFFDFFIFVDHFGQSVAKLMVLAHELLGLPLASQLETNYPNPFNSSTTLRYILSQTGAVELSVYDVQGQAGQALGTGGAEGRGLRDHLGR